MKGSRAFPFLLILLLLLGGCSGPPPAVTVRINPNHARVHVGLSVQLTSSVNNADNDAVTWQLGGSGCTGEACGRITSAGLYTAPATVPDPPQVTVTAVSVADPSKSAMAVITVLPAVEITVTPADPTVGVGRSLKFTAAVRNADDPRVVWTVTGAGCTGSGCGTVSDTGLFSAPTLVPSVPTVTVTAASVEDPAASGSATALIVLSAQSVEWGWMAGPQSVDTWGVYGAIGLPSPTVLPGARQGSAAWTDPAGGLWLFGGRGFAQNAIEGLLNDLWRFEPATGEWTWWSGSNTTGASGVYGSRGVADPANVPGGRAESSWCQDAWGGFWLFGGYGIFGDAGGWATGNDLWRFEPTTRQWTWISGSKTGDQAGVYGTKGVPDPANVPGARRHALIWADLGGTLWLFGGLGYEADSGRSGHLNDLWEYDPTGDVWTWVSGSDTFDPPGVYGTKGVADPANVPGARTWAISWIDLEGNLWLFGGNGPGWFHYNDLWMFDVGAGEWTWVSGSDSPGQPGVYGTNGVADPANVPGARTKAVPFRDPGGRLWLFGGAGHDSSGENTFLNDLWMFDPVTHEWTWASGSTLGNQSGIYGTKGETDPSNIPGARYGNVSWVDPLGNFWLFGGYGNNNYPYTLRFLSDLWKGLR